MDYNGEQGLKSKEVAKLQEHLLLLRQEYAKLQLHTQQLEKKLTLCCSTDKIVENNFLSQLYKLATSLYGSTLYSDLKIVTKESDIVVHKFLFATRSSEWGENSLDKVQVLDWSHIDKAVVDALVKWIYTDEIDLDQSDSPYTLCLMEHASKFQLRDLVNRCEKNLMATVSKVNCLQYYATAHAIGAVTLKEHCSSLISTYWESFTSKHFEHMSGEILYELFKTKTEFPLHSAVRLKREDVVFVYLVENVNQVKEVLNSLDHNGDLPLGLALKNRQQGIANTLVEHGADVDYQDNNGWTLLHKAVNLGDEHAARFLIEHGASVVRPTLDTGNSPLHLVAAHSPDTVSADTISAMVNVANLILGKGCDPNSQNKKGLTPLQLSVMAHNEDVFSLLLTRDSLDVNLANDEGHTALWYALICTTSGLLYNSNCFAARLIDRGAKCNPIYSKDHRSLLHILAEDGLEDAALFLCNYIEDFDHKDFENKTVLHVACRKNLGRLVAKLLEHGADPNITTHTSQEQQDTYGRTPLHTAIASNSLSAISAILDHKRSTVGNGRANGLVEPDLNIKDYGGDTPLSLSLSAGLVPAYATDLIEAGANVHTYNTNGITILHQAIKKQEQDIAIFLLDNGAKAEDKTKDGETTLELAIKYKLLEVVKALCKHKVELSHPDISRSYLWLALLTRQYDIAHVLVRHGIDTDFWSEGPEGCCQTLLHKAIDENEEFIANFLIRSGCDLNSPRRAGPGGRGGDEAFDNQTPLHLCCEWGLDSVVKTLIEHGANVNEKDSQGKTPFHVAIQNQHMESVTLLLCHPQLDVTIQDANGLTPFATALLWKNTKAAKAIKDKVPSVTEQFDSNGRNFLHMAIIKDDVETFLFLFSIGVDVNSRVRDTNQSTPLHLAAQVGNEMVVRNLLLANARPNDRDSNKRTPLHSAAEAGHEQAVIALLENNADFDATDSEGDNALHIAVREGHLAVVKSLLTESVLNAEAVNLKGRNPLHTLARYAKDNAASICELFLECMPNYPLDKPDLDGNTALILAYSVGHGNLCRTLVNAGACVGAMNKDGITIFNYQVASNSKTLLKRLLDTLNKEPPWVEGDMCLECGTKFGLTMRKHHCRHCGRLLCAKCSAQEVPILKFNLNKPVRVCGVCFDLLHVGIN